MRRVLTPLTNMLKPSYVLVRGYKLYVDKWDMEGAMIAKLIVVAWTLFVGYGYVGGIFEAATANPINGVFVVGLVVSSAGHLALWMVVALPTYMISRMFNRGQQPHPKVQRGWYD
jgi:hypothetical protein